jgi:flagellar assembly factor FliW
MQLTGTRFGEIETDAERIIVLQSGLIGFPTETRFVLLRPGAKTTVAWLQSLQTPALAFPIIESDRITPAYPSETKEALAGQAGIGAEAVSIFVVISVRPKSTKVVANLLAPIVVDRTSGTGAQIVLDVKKYSASTPLVSSALSEAAA